MLPCICDLLQPDSSVTPVFDAMVKSGAVSSNMFSMQLCGTIDKGQQDIATGGKLVCYRVLDT